MSGNVTLYDGEKIEPLDDTHSIIQSADGYRFGSDAVALAGYAATRIKKSDTVFDLCSGCGVIGIIIGIEKGCTVLGAEKDGQLHSMSVRSCALNSLDNVRFYNADIREKHDFGKFDVVVCNPPFFKANSRRCAVAPFANSELTVTLDEVARAARSLLKPHGKFYTVYTASRLDEALEVFRAHKLMPKELVVNENGKTFLLECAFCGRQGMTVRIGK